MRILFPILFWLIYFPILKIFTLFLFWNSKLEARERFEKKNKFEYLAQSFKEWNEAAELCFEFSSEGEYQQVAPLIEDALLSGKKIELVFFSPSVEKAIMNLAKGYPGQIRYLRYPLVRLCPFIPRRSFTHWVTAKTLIMVRYDLFPDFLLWSMKRKNELRIIWMTFKKERSQGRKPSFWKRLFLRYANRLVYAGVPDYQQGDQLGYKGRVFDFRIEQIRRRIGNRDMKFKEHFKLYPDFKIHLDKYYKKIILGNAWPSDLFLLKDLPMDYLLVVVPHQLSPQILELFKEGLAKLGRETFELTTESTKYHESATVLVNMKGILCELYADFPYCYVGGGFEGSIHSVLEPLVAGTAQLACGPFHHRSTEYDIAEEFKRISEVNTPEEFLNWLNSHPQHSDHVRMNSLINDYEFLREYVISC